jgi:hypothetical protein
MAMDCHLLIPELFLPESTGAAPYQELALPALETLFARGALQRHAGMSLERWLAAAFRVPPQYDQPLAAVSLRGEGVDPGEACWLQADPVHLKVQRDHLILADANCFEITAQEAADMLAALNAHFLQDGIEFVAPVPQRWYARTREEARIRTTPTAEVTGRSIERFLPAGDDAARWRRLASEAQMLLHQHPCNDARETRGELPINSIWFWGAGRMCSVGAGLPYRAVWSDHPLALGLAAGAGLEVRPLPQSSAQLMETGRNLAHDGPVLIVLDELRRAACNDLQAWRNALATLEARWFAPLLEALKRGALQGVTLHALGLDSSFASVYTRFDRFKFWRRRRRLAEY